MDILVQILINSLFTGSIYFLIAIGFTLIYGLLRVIHFAHTDIAITGVFVYILLLAHNTSPILAVLFSIGSSALLGLMVFVALYKPFLRKNVPTLVPLIVSVGISIILQNLLLLKFGDAPYRLQLFNNNYDEIYTLLGANYKIVQVLGIALALLVALLSSLLLKRTKLGLSIRAVSDDKELSINYAIQPNRAIGFTFLIYSPVALLGVFLTGLDTGILVQSSTLITIKSFTISLIGGIGSISGVFVCAMLISLLERVVGIFVSSNLKDIIVFVILLMILLARPNGVLRKS
jgi:branched-chain amino acid transport system permease protein